MIEGAGSICVAILRSSVASDAQRTPTYASRRWLPRASSGSQLAPAPGRVNLLRHTSFLSRQRRSTYTHVRLASLAPSGLVWLATCPSTRKGQFASPYFVPQSPATLNVHPRTPRVAGSFGPRLARNLPQHQEGSICFAILVFRYSTLTTAIPAPS